MIIQLGLHPSAYQLERLTTFLEDDGVIAIPTDTTYSLACLPNNKTAVNKMIALRRLDPKKPLALLFKDIRHMSEFAMVDDLQFRLLRRYLPGPYCFILEAKRSLPRFIGDKRKRIGARVPNHGVPLALLETLGRPLTVTSAIDPETNTMASDPWSVEAFFGHGLSAVVDAGEVPGGVSSIVDLTVDPYEVHRVGLGPTDDFD